MDKAAPPTFFNHYYSAELTTRGMLGSWRGHVDILREIVEKNLGSALILEDDVDWDINIKSQILKFARGSRGILESLDHGDPKRDVKIEETFVGEQGASPFGDPTKWDLLWLGHCGGWAPSASRRQYSQIIHNDPTVPPSSEIEDLTQGLDAEPNTPCSAHAGRDPNDKTCDSPRLKEDERIIQVGGSPTCSFGYAVTQMGARRLLYHVGGSNLMNVDGNFDTELTEVCRGDKDFSSSESRSRSERLISSAPYTPAIRINGVEDKSQQETEEQQEEKLEDVGGEGKIRCLTVSPPYFVHHRAKGSAARDSDMHVSERKAEVLSGKKEVVREKGVTRGVRWSVRLNAERLVEGKEAVSQYE